MKNILSLEKSCCGCMGCQDICPKNCISFHPDTEGFLYPAVDKDNCISCGVCLQHCPVAVDLERAESPLVFAAKLKDTNTVLKSTSGGVFSALANAILDQNGIVYGSAYDADLTVRHIAVEKRNDLEKLRGSKYVQSNTEGVYKKIKEQLNNGRFILFSGTGCQAGGLKAFLGKEYPNLFTVDIVCHGVPSPLLFKTYLEWMSQRLKGTVTEYSFRNKEKSGWDLVMKAKSPQKQISRYGFFDPYYCAFLEGKTYRESCYKCKFANSKRVSDITLGDYWGIEKEHPDFYDKKGVSLVLINSEKGKKLWNEVKNQTAYIVSDIDKASQMNKNLLSPSIRPFSRDTIYTGFDGNFNTYVKTKLHTGPRLKTRMKRLIPKTVKSHIKQMLKN